MRLNWSWRWMAAGLVVIVAACAALIQLVPDLHWRSKVVGLKLSGQVPELATTDLVRWLMPGSPVYLALMAERPTVESGIQNVWEDDPAYARRGEETYKRVCAQCHGGNAQGGSGPNLLDFLSRSPDWKFFSTVKWGRPGTGMAAQSVEERQIWEVHAFLRTKTRAWVKEAAAHLASEIPKVDVPFSKLVNAADHPEEWLMYSGDMLAQRHSKLNQINRGNVRDLKVAWATQLRPAVKPLSATPVVANGVMFLTEAPDGVVALDARDGRLLWRFTRPVDPSKLPVCCGAFNRGVAVLGSRVFVATLDSYLVALDAATGKKLWEVMVAPHKEGYTMTTAPLALDGKIVVGVAGGETGIRGFLAAYAADTGKEVWRFYTVPGPGEPGHETWQGDTWKTGGASTWSLGAYDPKLDILYWSTGNPWPPFDNNLRPGDNLYSNSIVALNPHTGKLLWHFQLTPADTHDWDATQQVILADITWKGEKVPAAIMASRNAFYYALDRRNGKFLYGKPFVKQTWAKGLDEKGRPIRNPEADPTPQGTMVYPWLHGGTNWWPPSYDPKRKLHFVPTVDAATIYFRLQEKLVPGTMTMGGTTVLATNRPAVMEVKALDPDTGESKWATRLDEGDFVQYARVTGLLSTDGDIVFAGLMDRLSILDSDTGAVLWKFRPGALVNAGPAAYSINGVQYFAIIAGNVLYAFSLPESQLPATARVAAAAAPASAASR
jgi:alcohol dehydrogenase (cytochrome c)